MSVHRPRPVGTLVSAFVVLLLIALVPGAPARAAGQPVTMTSPSVTSQVVDSTFVVAGTARPRSTVEVRYHRAGTAADDFSVVRTVTADDAGRWSRPAVLDTDYRVYATAPGVTSHSAVVLVVATPTLTSPSTALLTLGDVFAVAGRGAAGTTLMLHFHRQGTAASDYSIIRPVQVDASGAWTRPTTLDVDYRVYASRADGTGATPTALFAHAVAAPGTTVLPTTSQQVMVAHRMSGVQGIWARYEWAGLAWQRVDSPATTWFGASGVVPAARRVQNTDTTPAGTFAILSEFGPGSPGTAMPYRLVTSCSWWVQDPDQSDYNRWREQCGAPSSLGEHLADYTSNFYRQAAVIDYNYAHPIHTGYGSGAGIFLHFSTVSTGGCVGLTSSDELTATMRWMQPSAHPTIVIS